MSRRLPRRRRLLGRTPVAISGSASPLVASLATALLAVFALAIVTAPVALGSPSHHGDPLYHPVHEKVDGSTVYSVARKDGSLRAHTHPFSALHGIGHAPSSSANDRINGSSVRHEHVPRPSPVVQTQSRAHSDHHSQPGGPSEQGPTGVASSRKTGALASRCRLSVVTLTPRVRVMPRGQVHPGYGPESGYSCHVNGSEAAGVDWGVVRLHPFEPFMTCEGRYDNAPMRQLAGKWMSSSSRGSSGVSATRTGLSGAGINSGPTGVSGNTPSSGAVELKSAAVSSSSDPSTSSSNHSTDCQPMPLLKNLVDAGVVNGTGNELSASVLTQPGVREESAAGGGPAGRHDKSPVDLSASALNLADVGRWGRCALVLSASSLSKSSCGAAINDHDTVIRINGAPVGGYETDVGDRTDVAFYNWKMEDLVIKKLPKRPAGEAAKKPPAGATGGKARRLLSSGSVPGAVHNAGDAVANNDGGTAVANYNAGNGGGARSASAGGPGKKARLLSSSIEPGTAHGRTGQLRTGLLSRLIKWRDSSTANSSKTTLGAGSGPSNASARKRVADAIAAIRGKHAVTVNALGSKPGVGGVGSRHVGPAGVSSGRGAAPGRFVSKGGPRDPDPSLVVLSDDHRGDMGARGADCAQFRDELRVPALGMGSSQRLASRAMTFQWVAEMQRAAGARMPRELVPTQGFRALLACAQFCASIDVYGLGGAKTKEHYYKEGGPAFRGVTWSAHHLDYEAKLIQKRAKAGFMDVEVYEKGPRECPTPPHAPTAAATPASHAAVHAKSAAARAATSALNKGRPAAPSASASRTSWPGRALASPWARSAPDPLAPAWKELPKSSDCDLSGHDAKAAKRHRKHKGCKN